MLFIIRAFFIVIVLFCSAFALSKRKIRRKKSKNRNNNNNAYRKNLNEFVDELLKGQRKKLQRLVGSIDLPDKELEFAEGKGKAELTKGTLGGLNEIERKGNCELVFEKDVLNLEAEFGIDDLTMRYQADIDYSWPVGGKYDVDMKIKSVRAIIRGMQIFNQLDFHGDKKNLLNFDVAYNVRVDMGDIDINVGNFILEWFAENKVDRLRMSLQEMLKQRIRNAVLKLHKASFHELATN